MTNVAKMSIALTPEMAAMVTQAVETGEYATSGEVIREALREWNLRRSLMQQEQARLRELWAEGIASGPGQFKSMADIMAAARHTKKLQTAE